MRASIGIIAVTAAAVLGACVVPVEGAPCVNDDNCPSQQYCVENKCQIACVTSPGCTAANDVACAAGGDNLYGTCADVGGGCFRVQAITMCPEAAKVCDAGACVCPAASDTPTAGSGCATPGSTTCATDTLLTCVTDGGCQAWVPTSCSDEQLFCVTDAGVSACECGDFDAGTLYVDPSRGSVSGSVPYPTGALTPAQCRLRSIDEGLAHLVPGNPLVITGYPYDVWAASTTYPTDAIVTPAPTNGSRYRATTGGVSGATQPSWVTDGGTVNDGTAVWTNEGDDTVTFVHEHFPLTVPAGSSLTTDECLSTGCDPRHYRLEVFALELGSSSAPEMISLGAGTTLAGLTIQNVDSNNTAASTVACDTGAVVLDSLRLYGADSAGPSALGSGLNATGSCSPQVLGTFFGNFGSVNGNAAVLFTAPSGQMFIHGSELGVLDGGGSYPNWAGVVIANNADLISDDIQNSVTSGLIFQSGADAGVASSQIAFNGLGSVASPSYPGVLMQQGNVHFNGSTIHDNGAEGILSENGTLTVNMTGSGVGTTVTMNGATTNADAGAGIRVLGGTTTVLDSSLNNNANSGVIVEGPGILKMTNAIASGNGANGVTVLSGGLAYVTESSLLSNGAQGLWVTGGAAYVDAGTIASNGSVLGTAGVRAESTPSTLLWMSAVAVNNNVTDGIEALGPTTLLNDVVSDNGADGLRVSTSSTVTIDGGQFTGNGTSVGAIVPGAGIDVLAGTVKIVDALVSSNDGAGVQINTSVVAGGAATTINSCTIQGNHGNGVDVNSALAPGGVATFGAATVSIVNTEVTQNASSAISTRRSGVYFGPATGAASNTTLSAFTGNLLHENSGAQLRFDAPPATATWPLGGGCTNQFYEYNPSCGAGSSYGLVNNSGTLVDATDVAWEHEAPWYATGSSVPDAGTDIWAHSGAVTIEASPDCTAVSGGTICP